MGKIRKIIAAALIMLLSMQDMQIQAAPKDQITGKEFIQLLTDMLHLDSSKFYGTAVNQDKNITRQNAAVLVKQADDLLNGVNERTDDSPDNMRDAVMADKKQYEQIVKYKRIKDLDNIPQEKRADVIHVFQRGIMVGEENGNCAQDRTFHGNWLLSKEEAKKICNKIKDKKLRTKMSPDGQVIRTTSLPKNYKYFPYILESFPNSYYEKKFSHEVATYHAAGGKTRKPVEYEDYTLPVHMKNNTSYEVEFPKIAEEYLDNWIEKAEVNLQQRFNVDYRTVDQKWIQKLSNTYFQYGLYSPDQVSEMDTRQLNRIKKYVSEMKKNKVVIQSSKISVEPSSIYAGSGGYVFRIYVKFKVSANSLSDLNQVFYSGWSVGVKNLKKGVWMEKYFEIQVGTANLASHGEDFAVVGDDLIDMELIRG